MEKTVENIRLSGGKTLTAKKCRRRGRLEISLSLQSPDKCLLHWGVMRPNEPWGLAPESIRPAGSEIVSMTAIQTPFTGKTEQRHVLISLEDEPDFDGIVFALYYPESNHWDNNHHKNYTIGVPHSGDALISAEDALADETAGKDVVQKRNFEPVSGRSLAAAVIKEKEVCRILMLTDMPGKLVLHWGVALKARYEWNMPPAFIRPPGTTIQGESAVQTPFSRVKGLNRLLFECPWPKAPLGIPFVLTTPATGEWFNDRGDDFFLPVNVPASAETTLSAQELTEIADRIILAEAGNHSWTLMHRFNLCHDLLERTDSVAGLALFFVWLRYSALRQLDWQRNYNTQPRELTHSQQRLTLQLAAGFKTSGPDEREIIRLIFSTIGRGAEGGKGQRIRDDILHIMHRHRIKEVSGHFMEEWHQKLHNNATPDDIVICEAYLAFLRSNGDLRAFYKTLEEGGVTRRRLRSFERPIVTDPDFVPHIKDGLIHDFENYLKLLQSVHSATDLASALDEAGYCLGDQLRNTVEWVYFARDDAGIDVQRKVYAVTEARSALYERLKHEENDRCIRDMLYLDLSLEEFLRTVVERNIHKRMRREELSGLIPLLLDNVGLYHAIPGLALCADHWRMLQESRFASNRDQALREKAVLERISASLGAFTDYYYVLLQDKAGYIGNGCRIDPWIVNLFTQEIVRGGSAFLLSLLVRLIEPLVRKASGTGDWQVISPSDANGLVQTGALASMQDKSFDVPTVIVSDTISGEEEIPPGVTAVITPAVVDVLSHVSVRARNGGVLFAVCYDPKNYEALKTLNDKTVSLTVSGSGGVEFEEIEMRTGAKRVKSSQSKARIPLPRPAFRDYALPSRDFTDKIVGGKSYQLQHLKGKLPDWVLLPSSVALPFGVCEQVLAEKENKSLAKQYEKLAGEIDAKPKNILPELRKTVMALNAPERLFASLDAAMKIEGLEKAEDWGTLWSRIKHVWASKWNDRACWSRKKWQVPHDALLMAVLIQQVVAAEYAFVIHTANPSSGSADELYAEIVCGLGETLCSGNYPGRAFGFTCGKSKKLKPKIVSYPSKGVALSGGGLIVRSDSNGEDLEEYAGAGLYDSVLLTPPRERVVDYTNEPLMVDAAFREMLIEKVAELGIAVEKAMGGRPQDIEGAFANGEFYVVQTRPQV